MKRHSTLIEDVLKLYQSQVQGGKVGSSEAFKKYGDGNPRNVIYKFANLIVKDINSILANHCGVVSRRAENSRSFVGS